MYFETIIHHTLYYVNVIFTEHIFSSGGLEAWMHYPRLRDLREDCDLTQEQLVEALGMHKTTYTNYEQGKREIPFALVIRLANYYTVSINYIAGIDKRPAPLIPTAPAPGGATNDSLLRPAAGVFYATNACMLLLAFFHNL